MIDQNMAKLVKTDEVYGAYLQGQCCLRCGRVTKAHHSIGDDLQSWEPGAHYTVCRQLNQLGIVLARCLSWSKPFPGNTGLSAFPRPIRSLSSLQLLLCSHLFYKYV